MKILPFSRFFSLKNSQNKPIKTNIQTALYCTGGGLLIVLTYQLKTKKADRKASRLRLKCSRSTTKK
jgi:hypothetical protein